ncbi:MAG: VWA domain-containing protein [Proteobacteria bacterium]|nr:VWA domain-containing protein [Pseudomonadota bacterium]
MIYFDWPWVAALLPLPLIIRFLSEPVETVNEAALRVPFLHEFSTQTNNEYHIDVKRRLFCLALVAWCLLISAGMRPQWLGDFIDIPVSGRDLMLAVDLSGSMEQEDFIIKDQRVNRLVATKHVAGQFIERRTGDRLGLILFGERAYLQTPLTFDRETVKTLLYESAIGLAGKSTAIGDAIGLAVKRLRDQDEQSRVLILLTDGANTSGEVEPLVAADLAAREGLKIYTIGIGADEMIVRSFFGARRVNPSAELDEKTLQAIADKTGGRYFRARDTEQLEKIYGLLDELEPIEKDVQRFRPRAALFYWPLAMALVFMLVVIMVRNNISVSLTRVNRNVI